MFKWIPKVLDYFKIYDPSTKVEGKKGTRSKTLTPVEFWEYAATNKKKLGIFSAVIDSWNYMRHDVQGYGREDKWLEDVLSYRNEIAERENCSAHEILAVNGTSQGIHLIGEAFLNENTTALIAAF